MTPTEAAAWLRHGGEVPEHRATIAGLLETVDKGWRATLYDRDVEAIRTLVELADLLEKLRDSYAAAIARRERLEAEGGTA